MVLDLALATSPSTKRDLTALQKEAVYYNCGGNPCGTVYKLTESNRLDEAFSTVSPAPPDGDTPESGVIFDQIRQPLRNDRVRRKPKDNGWYSLRTFALRRRLARDDFDYILRRWLDVPIGGLIFDPLGNLYGTGSQSDDGECCGGVFEFTPSGGNWIYSILYLFTSSPAAAGGPFASLIMDAAGNLYGTTYGTGPYMYSYGTVFKLTQSGGQWNETDLYAFTDGDDGSFRKAM